jgi:hypothetical protein
VLKLFGNALSYPKQSYVLSREIFQNGVENQDGEFLLYIFLRPPALSFLYRFGHANTFWKCPVSLNYVLSRDFFSKWRRNSRWLVFALNFSTTSKPVFSLPILICKYSFQKHRILCDLMLSVLSPKVFGIRRIPRLGTGGLKNEIVHVTDHQSIRICI